MASAVQILGSREARDQWREVLDAAILGKATVVERYGKPVAAVVPVEVLEELKSNGEAIDTEGHLSSEDSEAA